MLRYFYLPGALLMTIGALAVSALAATLPDPAQIKPEPVVITNDYTEGVVLDHAGNLYFSHGTKITKVTPDGKASDWAVTGSPNGHKILPNGEHLVCDGSRKAVLRLDAQGQILKSAAYGQVEDLEIRTPNDLTLDPEGGFYFTDSVNDTGAVYYVTENGRKNVVARNINFANGIVLTPDRKRLYVAESQENRVLVIRLKRAGVPDGAPKVFADLPKNTERPGKEDNQPDGMALDADGRLWVAHYGMKSIHVLDKEGKLLATYDGGNRTTSNLCFAGPDNATVYATGGEPGGLFRLPVNVPGLKILK
jgi:gluconolactonase